MTTHAYVAIRPCGCVAAVVPDTDPPAADVPGQRRPKRPARELAAQYRGCVIKRLPMDEAVFTKCQHEKGNAA